MKYSTHWNYRRVTYIVKGVFIKPYRLFAITEVYYDINGIPNSYIQPDDIGLLTNLEDILEIRKSYKLIKGAFKQPILDIDHLPNEYTGE